MKRAKDVNESNVLWRQLTPLYCYGALRKETEGLEKVNFTECIIIAGFRTILYAVITAATVKINKMADGGFPRWEGKQCEFLLIVSNDDCIIK